MNEMTKGESVNVDVVQYDAVSYKTRPLKYDLV